MPRMIVRNSWGGDLVKECLCRDVFNALFTISGLSSIERRQVCELLKRVKMEVVFARKLFPNSKTSTTLAMSRMHSRGRLDKSNQSERTNTACG